MGRASRGRNRPSSPEARDPAAAAAAIFLPGPPQRRKRKQEDGLWGRDHNLKGSSYWAAPFNPRSLRTLLRTDLVLVKKLAAAELEGACALHLPCARPSSCRFHSGEAQRKRKSCGVNPDIGNRSLRWSPWTARGGSEHKPPCLKCHSPVSPTPDLALVFHSTWHNNRRHQHYFVCLS